MFKDTEEELKRLEAELLADEEEALPEEELDQEAEPLDDDLLTDEELNALLDDTRIFGSATVYQNHANNYGQQIKAYNADTLDQDPEDLSQELLEENKGGTGGLIALACVLAIGILCVAVWWVARYWGMF